MDPILFLLPQAQRTAPAGGPPVAAEIVAELDRIVAAPAFAKAARARALLTYLVRRMLDGGTIKEQAIGMEVFDRSATDYDAGDDPIVRVQMGRLRDRLAQYYAGEGRANPLRIDVPMGGYRPAVTRTETTLQPCGLAFQPLTCLSRDWAANSFTQGLNDELSYRLHRAFAGTPGSTVRPMDGASPQPALVLEGSVRQGDSRLRTSLRLLDRAAGVIAWCEQLDHGTGAVIAVQEALAALCCDALRTSLAQLVRQPHQAQ